MSIVGSLQKSMLVKAHPWGTKRVKLVLPGCEVVERLVDATSHID